MTDAATLREDDDVQHVSVDKKAWNRNLARLKWADLTDSDMISKYLTSSPYEVLHWVPTGPDDHFVPPSALMASIAAISVSDVRTPQKSPIIFEPTLQAAQINAKLLEEQGGSLRQLIELHQNSTLGYGSEFRPLWQLDRLLQDHPNYPPFRSVIMEGLRFIGKETPPADQLRLDLEAAIARGNHKSAKENLDQVRKLLGKDVAHGFAIPLSLQAIRSIPNAQVQPIGMVRQWSLDEDGTRIEKLRLTHDASFPPRPGSTSINDRIDLHQYGEMIYGWCFPRIIHYIVALRKRSPGVRILIAKFDYSDAYRRIAHSSEAAAQQILVVDDIAFVMLRMTFGGSANPPTWCSFSEMVTDLSNEIVLANDWDPKQVFSPLRMVVPTPRLLPDTVPFGSAADLAFDIPMQSTVRTDCFIDDLVNVILDTEENRWRGAHAVPLAVHVTSRPHAGGDEPLPRRNLLGDEKLAAEGTHSEVQIVLGWKINCRTLMVSLPTDKFTHWANDLAEVVSKRTISFQNLESLLGRLNHAALVIPLSGHFLNRIRQRISSRSFIHQQLSLRRDEIDDLRLWQMFLHHAHQGLSMNLLVHRRPTVIGCSDSCPMGIGGFLLDGFAWRLRIPTCSLIYQRKQSNNVLEFLGMAINIWIATKRGQKFDCILALGDNTSALGWLFHSSKIDPKSIYYDTIQLIARQVATLVMNASVCLAAQHLQGVQNDVADLLSYYGDLRGKTHPLAHDNPDNTTLTMRFHQFCHQLIPRSFAISQLPSDVLSWTALVLQTFESSLIRSSKHLTRPRIATGDAGTTSLSPSDYLHQQSLTFPSRSPKSLPDHSWRPTAPLNLTSQEEWLASVRKGWYHRLSELPQAVWLRRCGTVTNQAPFTSKGAPSFSPQSAPF